MKRTIDLHKEWSSDADYVQAYDALEDEFSLIDAFIAARNRAGLSQTELAKRMHISQSYISRMESGTVQPSSAILRKFTEATDSRLVIRFEPLDADGDRAGL